VSPAAFIPVAEEMGHIHSLGAFVLEVACREATYWPRDVKIAVNVSALQFEAGDIVGAVRRALVNSGLEAQRLELEITESAFATDTDRLRETFTDLLALGVSFALDDYGTGFSSLGYLHRFPISKIKIDRSFVTDAPTSSQSMAVLRSIITLGDGLKIRTIAEGIETIEQAQALRAIGCAEGQGYLYSKPISSAAFRTLVTKRSTEPESLLLAAS
jgi:EAL domain-containing protein (putative c-di-GMP-specific phosphodiesterase class I)